MNRLQIYGARGSYPIYDEGYRRYGGNTSCYSLETPQGLMIFDAGTGLTLLGELLNQRVTLPPITIFLTHVHLDHIIGLPSFKPFLRRDATITVMIEPAYAAEWRGAIMTLVAKPFWPADFLQLGASIRFEDMPSGPLSRYGVTIKRCTVYHPQGGVSYRIETAERAVVLATDREHGEASRDQAFVEFARDTDVLIHDAQYTPAELPQRRGWGHSTWEQSVQVAHEVGAHSLVLVSHDPSRKDDEIDWIVEQARQAFPKTAGGLEGMVLTLAKQEPDLEEQSAPDPLIAFRYRFMLAGGRSKTFVAQLDPYTLQVVREARASYPDWTRLEHSKCPNCPLKEAEQPHCPAALSIIDVVEFFNQSVSFEEVDVEVQTKERRYQKRCSLQEAIGSLIGIYMPISGCPVMAKLKPMARFHLPFSSPDETFYRVLSMYLLAQYFAAKQGRSADWQLKDLVALYREILTVDTHFFRRLQPILVEDAGLNAIVRLHSMANAIEFTVDQGLLEETQRLFQAYLDQGNGAAASSPSASP